MSIRLSPVPTAAELQAVGFVLPDFAVAERHGSVLLTLQRQPLRGDPIPLVTYTITPTLPEGFAHPTGWEVISYLAQTVLNLRRSLEEETEHTTPMGRIIEIMNAPVLGTTEMLLQQGEFVLDVDDLHTAEAEDWFG